jgi:hypothetical protein
MELLSDLCRRVEVRGNSTRCRTTKAFYAEEDSIHSVRKCRLAFEALAARALRTSVRPYLSGVANKRLKGNLLGAGEGLFSPHNRLPMGS